MLMLWLFLITEWELISVFFEEALMLYAGAVISMMILAKGNWKIFE